MTRGEQIYAHYLLAVLLGQPIYTVAEQLGISRKRVYEAVEKVEKKQKYPVGKNVRAKNWEFRYQPMWKLAKAKEMKHAIMRDMYYRGGYDVAEIHKYTGTPLTALHIVLFG